MTTTLAKYYSSNLVGFFSYSREDDADFGDVLSKLRIVIQAELSAQLGRNRDNFRIWQDKFAIPHGALWQQQITDGIKQSAFYIPIITPRVVNSTHCAFEFNSFLAREKELGRNDLVFPVLYISVPELEDGTWQENPVLKIVEERQYLDWRDYRPRELSEPEVRTKLIQFCRNISNALRKPWESPEEREQTRRAAAERAAAKKDRSAAAQIEVEEKSIRSPRVEASSFAEGELRGKAQSPEPEPLLAVVKHQDGRDTVFGSPLGIAQLPKSKAPRTVMMVGGSLAAVMLIGALAWTLNNGAPSREHAPVISTPQTAPVKLPTATAIPESDKSHTATAALVTPSEPVGAAPQPASPPPSVATAAAPQIGGGGSAGTPPLDPGADVVRAFYGALARGDGALAATFLIPEKQKGGLAPQAMTSFYSRLSQPLQLTNVMPIDRTNYQATYSYRTTAMTCNNSVIVTLTQRGGRYLIQGIDARGGC